MTFLQARGAGHFASGLVACPVGTPQAQQDLSCAVCRQVSLRPFLGRRMSPYVGTSVSDWDIVGGFGLSLSSPGHCFVLLWPLSPASRPGLGRSLGASLGKFIPHACDPDSGRRIYRYVGTCCMTRI